MENMELYNKFRSVPKNAQKPISGGRLKGMTDINPMWRIKCLTEAFGSAGTGWYTMDEKYTTEKMESGETALFCSLRLFYEGCKSPVFGVGGSMLISKEKSQQNGYYLRIDDEAYKKAYTDAVSVACKSLGIGADVYWDKDSTKYTTPEPQYSEPKYSDPQPFAQKQQFDATCERCGCKITDAQKRDKTVWEAKNVAEYSKKRFGGIFCPDCMKALQKAKKDRENGGGN